MAPKGRDRCNIFYKDTTNEFHEMCTTYSIYGSFHPPKSQTANTDAGELGTERQYAEFINLIHEDQKYSERENSDDIWMNNAKQIYSSIRQISSLIEKNSNAYTFKDIFMEDFDQGLSNAMSEQDVTMFESSLASFMTATASQIDSLRQSNQDITVVNMLDDVRSHRNGILSHLMSELREIMDEFQRMQVMRHREELDSYRDPLKCSYYKGEEEGDVGIGEIRNEFELDEEYLDMLEREEEEFKAFYEMNDSDEALEKILAEPLPSFPKPSESREEISKEVPVQAREIPMPMGMNKGAPQLPVSTDGSKLKTRNVGNAGIPSISNQQVDQNQAAILQQEQIFLTTKVQNTKLDAAHKVESQMMQITSLLSQFSSLITEQQEEIQVIADSTVKSRQNVDKGREKLVQATEQRKKSRHYFAWVIFGLGVLLLFMNAVLA